MKQLRNTQNDTQDTSQQQEETYVFDYRFELEDGKVITYKVELSKEGFSIADVDEANAPEWTNLISHQCAGCPLRGKKHCPVSLRLVEPINMFKDMASIIKTKVTVTTQDRTYYKETDLQDGLRSLFGLIMATSGCPSMEPFRPMARFHLPFSTIDETVYRVISMYLLQRFFADETQEIMHVNMHDIQALYDTIQRVNQGIFERLKDVSGKDGMLNAVAILDSLAMLVPFYVECKMDKVRSLFQQASK